MSNPLCPYFGSCGGCSSQHIDYGIQLENKKKALINAINLQNIQVFSGKEYHYRNRMDFIFHQKGLGFREKDKWHSVVDVQQCAIANEKINSLLSETRNFFKDNDSFDLKTQTGTLRYAVIRASKDDDSISFVLNADSKRVGEAIEKIKEFSALTSVTNIVIAYNPSDIDESFSDDFFVVKGKDTLKENYLGKEFIYPIQGFFQNNPQMAEKMHQYCHGIFLSYNTKEAHLLDLYGGVGCFGILNSPIFRKVIIVESVKPSIDCANINIKNNNAVNTRAILMDANQIRRLAFNDDLFVVTDPPRTGMDPNTISYLKKIKPKVIIYISCNVQQLRKDILKFKEYKVKSAALFDFFPQTPHSEAVVELVLS